MYRVNQLITKFLIRSALFIIITLHREVYYVKMNVFCLYVNCKITFNGECFKYRARDERSYKFSAILYSLSKYIRKWGPPSWSE